MTPEQLYWTLGGLFVLSIVFKRLEKNLNRKRKTKKSNNPSKKQTISQRTSNEVHSDGFILSSSLEELTWGDFERLLTLYFQGNGYTVEETGTKVREGNFGDGGVDLVITDRKGERTAVQAKHWSGNVGVDKIRELNSAKRNYNCILSLLVTSADLTPQAKQEAEMLKVEYWHGASLIHKLEKWGKWKPLKKKSSIKPARREVAAASENTYTCVTDKLESTDFAK